MYFSCLSCFMFNFNSCIQNVRPSLPSSHMSLYVRSGVTVSTVSCRYFVCVAVLLYFLPLLVMGCAYLVVGLTLWASEIPGDSSDRYKEQLTAKRKVTCNQITPLPSACVVPPVRNLSPESQPLSLSLSFSPALLRWFFPVHLSSFHPPASLLLYLFVCSLVISPGPSLSGVFTASVLHFFRGYSPDEDGCRDSPF